MIQILDALSFSPWIFEWLTTPIDAFLLKGVAFDYELWEGVASRVGIHWFTLEVCPCRWGKAKQLMKPGVDSCLTHGFRKEQNLLTRFLLFFFPSQVIKNAPRCAYVHDAKHVLLESYDRMIWPPANTRDSPRIVLTGETCSNIFWPSGVIFLCICCKWLHL